MPLDRNNSKSWQYCSETPGTPWPVKLVKAVFTVRYPYLPYHRPAQHFLHILILPILDGQALESLSNQEKTLSAAAGIDVCLVM